MQGSSTKNDGLIEENPIMHFLSSLNTHKSTSEPLKCTKIWETFFNYVSTDPETFITLSQKTPEIFRFLQTA